MPAFAEADDKDALPVLRHDALRINHAVVNVIAEGVGQRVMDDLEGAPFIVPLEVFHVFQHERVGLVMVNQVREFEKEVALFLVLEAVFLAEAQFLGDARDAEGLAGKAGAQNVVRRNGVVRTE